MCLKVAADLRQGRRLVRLLAEREPAPLPVQLVHPRGRLTARRVEVVWKGLEERLGGALRQVALEPGSGRGTKERL